MVEEQKDCKIPSRLLPKCPVCGRPMEMNLRADDKFVQDDGWYEHAEMYQEFVEKMRNKKTVLIEVGVGYNTPSIIKFPFEQMTFRNKDTNLIRINTDYPICRDEIMDKCVVFGENAKQVIKNLK